jgi:hypothetical protein
LARFATRTRIPARSTSESRDHPPIAPPPPLVPEEVELLEFWDAPVSLPLDEELLLEDELLLLVEEVTVTAALLLTTSP